MLVTGLPTFLHGNVNKLVNMGSLWFVSWTFRSLLPVSPAKTQLVIEVLSS
jgi:hypothetical protein